MNIHSFFPNWKVLGSLQLPDSLHLYLESAASSGYCPSCRTVSHRRHSWYWRKLLDQPLFSKTLILFIKSRKFFCTHLSCEQKIFTERHPDWYEPYARQTSRLHDFLRRLAFSLSAEAASRLTISFGIPTSADTFLRIVRKEVIPMPTDFSIIGIDDWALKKGTGMAVLSVILQQGNWWPSWKAVESKM